MEIESFTSAIEWCFKAILGVVEWFLTHLKLIILLAFILFITWVIFKNFDRIQVFIQMKKQELEEKYNEKNK